MNLDLQFATEQYQVERSVDAARKLCDLLIQTTELGNVVQLSGVGLLGQNCLSLRINNREITYSHHTKLPIACYDGGVLFVLDRTSIQNISAREDTSVQRLSRQLSYVLNLIEAIVQKEVSERELYSLCHEQFEERLNLLLKYISEHLDDNMAPILAAETYLQIINKIQGKLISVDWDLASKRKDLSDIIINLGTFKLLCKFNQPIAAIQSDSKQCFHIDAKWLRTGVWQKYHGLRSITQFLSQDLSRSGRGSVLAQFNCQTVSQELLRLLLS